MTPFCNGNRTVLLESIVAVKVAVVVEAVVDRGMGSGELLQSLLEFSKNNFKKYIKSPLGSYIH